MKRLYVQPDIEIVNLIGNVALLIGSVPGPDGQNDPNDPFGSAPWRY